MPVSTAVPPFTGLKGLVVKTHGSSKSMEICNSVLQCIQFKSENISGQIQEHITEV